jgi:TfoX/Sxy family transcriptional regulator of competence genes
LYNNKPVIVPYEKEEEMLQKRLKILNEVREAMAELKKAKETNAK